MGKDMNNATKRIRTLLEALHDDIVSFSEEITAMGGKVYIVGGAVRDMFIGSIPKDIDLELSGISVDQLENGLQNKWIVKAAGQRFGVWIVVRAGSDTSFEVCLPQKRIRTGSGHKDEIAIIDTSIDIVESLGRRDFTVNSMAIDITNGVLFDPFGGVRDIQQRVLCPVSDSAFASDPLRVLRGFSFASRFGFTASDSVRVQAKANIDGFYTLSNERVRVEWQKFISGSFLSHGIQYLLDTDWIQCFPTLANVANVEQDTMWHPEGNVIAHTMQVIDHIAAHTQDVVSRWAGLLHDVGKVSTTTVRDDGRIVSPGHAEESASLVQTFMQEIGVEISKNVQDWITQVERVVEHHMWAASMHERATDRAIRRLVRSLSPASITQWAEVCIGDISGRGDDVNVGQVNFIVNVAGRASQMIDVTTNGITPIVTGQVLIDHDVIQPGRRMGTVIAAAMDAQVDGTFTTVAGGVQWARDFVSNMPA